MWLAVIISIACFAGMCAVVFHAYWQLKQERTGSSTGEADTPTPESEYANRSGVQAPPTGTRGTGGEDGTS